MQGAADNGQKAAAKEENVLYGILFPNGERNKKGIPSICSSNRYVIKAAFKKMAENGLPVIIESTANQVDQFGGYTGMQPADFARFVYDIAGEAGFPLEKLVLGGDHLGPLTFKSAPEEEAMAKAEALVAAYVAAGYSKIHIDTSMRLSCDDVNQPLETAVSAKRAARLVKASEETFAKTRQGDAPLLYIVGSEVPVPGGADEESIHVTTPEDFDKTVTIFKEQFEQAGIGEAFARVVGVVVQPGVEFGNYDIVDYNRAAAASLTAALEKHSGIVFEGHSTDYQITENLRRMAEDGIVIQKVGPAVTFAFREAIYALEQIEKTVLQAGDTASRLFETLDEVMLAEPKYWKAYYTGTEQDLARERIFGLSDRCRYYLNDVNVEKALAQLIENLGKRG
ncbi:MAG: class II D-tagatose-bisphosphate aldolase, non-catalytic subunit, partial [Clostridiales bacterium]|nr:class II D-tagatose-bisphosphate aldolase, non-catalytic subunit [Clostridiales bacterium]